MHNATWHTITSENSGLPANHVTGIAQDDTGNLWFATYGGGLCRRSACGRDWQSYRAADGSLANDYVGAVTVDAEGRVWVVCDGRKVDNVKHPGSICVLSPDGIWQTYPRAADENCVRCLEADRNGTLWLRTGGSVVSGGITRCDGIRDGAFRFQAAKWQAFDGTTWTAYDGDRAAAAAWYPHRPARTRLGWELEGDVLWLLEASSSESIQPSFPPGASPLPGFMPEINLFFGSFLCDYSLISYDGREWKKRASIPSPFRFGELVVDRQGHKWVSLFQLGDLVMSSGVARLDGERDGGEWTVFNKDTGLLSDYVMALSADSQGNVWLSHPMGDLCRWDGSRWVQFPGGQDGRGDKDLGRCIEDHQGRLWFPSRSGAVVYTP